MDQTTHHHFLANSSPQVSGVCKVGNWVRTEGGLVTLGLACPSVVLYLLTSIREWWDVQGNNHNYKREWVPACQVLSESFSLSWVSRVRIFCVIELCEEEVLAQYNSLQGSKECVWLHAKGKCAFAILSCQMLSFQNYQQKSILIIGLNQQLLTCLNA